MQTECETPSLIALPFPQYGESNESDKTILLVCIIKLQSMEGMSAHKPLDLRNGSMCAEHDNSISVKLTNLESMAVDLKSSSFQPVSFRVTDGTLSQSFSLPVSGTSCRISSIALEDLGLSISIVHDVVSYRSDIDRFIEEQDFMYSCMEIQEEFLLQEQGPIECSSLTKSIPATSPVLPTEDDVDFDQELNAMESLIQKYQPKKMSIPNR